MDKVSAGQAILELKCPRCRQGDLFKSKAYGTLDFYKMHHQCPVCEQGFDPEPGFYFGAMYISYGFIVAISITCWVALYITIKPPFITYIVVILSAIVLLLPLIFRYSRTLFLYAFGGIKYSNRK